MSVKLHPQFVVNERGEKRSVLLSIDEYRAMLEELEYHADCLALKQAIETATLDDFEDWEVVKERLSKLEH